MCTPKPLYHDHHAEDASHIQRLKEPKNRRKMHGHLPTALPLIAPLLAITHSQLSIARLPLSFAVYP